MIIRDLKKEECSRLAEIDPSFVTDKIYTVECVHHSNYCLMTKKLDKEMEIMPPMFGSTSPSAALWYQDRFNVYESFIVAEEDGKIVGAACMFPLAPALKDEVSFLGLPGERLISSLAVDRSHRGRGIGRALLDEIKARSQELKSPMLGLWTGLCYHPAIEFYIAEGFVISGWQAPPGCKFDQCRVYLTWRPLVTT